MLSEVAASMLERGDTGFRNYAGNDVVCAAPSLVLAARDGLHISLNCTPFSAKNGFTLYGNTEIASAFDAMPVDQANAVRLRKR